MISIDSLLPFLLYSACFPPTNGIISLKIWWHTWCYFFFPSVVGAFPLKKMRGNEERLKTFLKNLSINRTISWDWFHWWWWKMEKCRRWMMMLISSLQVWEDQLLGRDEMQRKGKEDTKSSLLSNDIEGGDHSERDKWLWTTVIMIHGKKETKTTRCTKSSYNRRKKKRDKRITQDVRCKMQREEGIIKRGYHGWNVTNSRRVGIFRRRKECKKKKRRIKLKHVRKERHDVGGCMSIVMV